MELLIFRPKNEHFLKALNEKHKVILATFVKPYALSKLTDLSSFEGIIVGYQNNNPAQEQVAQLILGKKEAKEKLPVSIHPAFPAGHGIITTSAPQALKTLLLNLE